MKFLSTLKAERCLTQLSTLHGSESPEAHKALESLRAIGADAAPAVIDALGSVDKELAGALITVLASYLNDKTFPLFVKGLGHSNQQCINGVAKALAISTSYDTNKLLDLLGRDDHVPGTKDGAR